MNLNQPRVRGATPGGALFLNERRDLSKKRGRRYLLEEVWV